VRLASRLASALCSTALIAGCGAERVSGVPVTEPLAPVAGTQGCAVAIDSVEDQRDATNLGHLGRTRVTDEGFMRWLTDGLKTLPGYVPGGAEAIHLHVTVLKAYINGHGSMKSANLVVRVREPTDDGERGWPKIYRGVDDSLNWANAEAEVQLSFQQALEDLKRQIAGDLARRCRQEPGIATSARLAPPMMDGTLRLHLVPAL